MLQKPESCSACVLFEKGHGWIPASGSPSAPILFVGEAGGYEEAIRGEPFVGQAGGMLSRLLALVGMERESVRIDNIVRCSPPGNWLEGAPWEWPAVQHCTTHHLADTLREDHQILVPLGNSALRHILQLGKKKNATIQNFHGTINRDPSDRFWVVPTYHPSHLQRGAHNLIGTVTWDLQQALKLLQDGLPTDEASLIVDPDVAWFTAWVDTVLQAIAQDREAYPLSVDVETPDKAGGKDEGEITQDDQSYVITRVNVACHPDEGITVPFQGPYVDLLRRLLTADGRYWLWNKEYDVPRLQRAELTTDGIDHQALDLMWFWHILQSDVPRGLGFVAPFYSTYGAWKHLADSDPAKYGAIDGLQTHRVGFGILKDLRTTGLLAVAQRHVHDLHALILKPAQQVGVKVDRQRLTIFKEELAQKATRLLDTLTDLYPDAIRPLSPKQGLTKRPAENVLHVKATAFTRKGTKRKGKEASEIKQDLYKKAIVVERQIEKEVLCCQTCGATEISRKHRCLDKLSIPEVQLLPRMVTRFYWQEPFNPDSWQQVLTYIKFRKHTPGKAKKTHKDSTDRETLERLVKTGDPFYPRLLDYRAIQKVKGTYVDGTERRLDADDRLHPEPTFKPSTHRLSYQNPNITNVAAGRSGDPDKVSLAASFRRCLVASPSTRLLEVDFSGSEAVDVGWFSRSADYIRLAKLGVHAGLASHILKRPYDPTGSDQDLAAYFKTIKKSKDPAIQAVYDRAKRYVHGASYGLTIPGMVLQFPETFPTQKIATEYAEIFRTMAPAIPAWQRQVRERAAKQHYLGGPGDHPFGYKHWFWSVFTYKKITRAQYEKIVAKARKLAVDPPVALLHGQPFKVGLGEDGKRAVAFYPQSTTAGKLKEVLFRLFEPGAPSYIGDAYFGKTPLRAPIHDSLLLEFPIRTFDYLASLVIQEMQRPFVQMPCPEEWGLGPYLSTGVSAKTGLDWGTMEDLEIGSISGVGADTVTTAALDEESEEVSDLERTA